MCVRIGGDRGKCAGDVRPPERRSSCLQSRDNKRVRENTARPGSNRRMSDREQIDGLEELRRCHSEGRSYGCSMTQRVPGYKKKARGSGDVVLMMRAKSG